LAVTTVCYHPSPCTCICFTDHGVGTKAYASAGGRFRVSIPRKRNVTDIGLRGTWYYGHGLHCWLRATLPKDAHLTPSYKHPVLTNGILHLPWSQDIHQNTQASKHVELREADRPTQKCQHTNR